MNQLGPPRRAPVVAARRYRQVGHREALGVSDCNFEGGHCDLNRLFQRLPMVLH